MNAISMQFVAETNPSIGFVLLLGLITAGCGPSAKSGAGTGPQKAPPLTIVVIDDPSMAKAIAAEWRARSDDELTIREAKEADVAQAQRLPGDVVLLPAGMIGELAEAGLIAPLSEQTLASEAVNLRDFYMHLRLHEMKWGNKVYALSLGSPQWTLLYRADIFEKLGITPPHTWEEYTFLAQRLSKREELGELAPPADQPWRGAVEPLAAGYAGNLLLARAAAYAAHQEQISPLFELHNLRPLIAEEPYVRALKEVIEAQKQEGSDLPMLTAEEARREILAGRCGMAISWPSGERNDESAGKEATVSAKGKIGCAELPGAGESFDFGDKKWTRRKGEETPHVPLLAVSGRLAAVTTGTRERAAAEKLVVWLAGKEAGPQISSQSRATTLFRLSQEASAARWMEGADPRQIGQYLQTLRDVQSRPQPSPGIRIPGRTEYLAALDAAVLSAAEGQQTPEEALAAAAAKWQEITKARGLEAQRKALQRSLGFALGD